MFAFVQGSLSVPVCNNFDPCPIKTQLLKNPEKKEMLLIYFFFHVSWAFT